MQLTSPPQALGVEARHVAETGSVFLVTPMRQSTDSFLLFLQIDRTNASSTAFVMRASVPFDKASHFANASAWDNRSATAAKQFPLGDLEYPEGQIDIVGGGETDAA